jgi:hypothetical protein
MACFVFGVPLRSLGDALGDLLRPGEFRLGLPDAVGPSGQSFPLISVL